VHAHPALRCARLVAAVAALALVVAACVTGAPAVETTPFAVETTRSAAPSPTERASASPPSCVAPAVPVDELGRLARVGPDSGAWVGLNLDWGSETVAAATARLGAPPAAVVSFVPFPLEAGDARNLEAAAEQASAGGAVLLLTLEPWRGLGALTDEAIEDLIGRLAGYGTRGTPTIVRFAHEMNGSWYPWGQDPAAYVEAYRRVAAAVHGAAPTAAMLWAPNHGDGYPYVGGTHQAKPGSAAEAALDTDGDGRLGPGDDPYGPYWPGMDAVDWVGMSLYHWGAAYPWGENEVPAAGTFARLITGSSIASEVPLPDFYAEYAERFGKPMAIVETAAFYRPGGGGASEAAIKTAWLDDVFAPGTRSQFPLLRLVNWFEWRKHEREVDAVVDWRVTADASLRAAFLAAMTDGFHLGPAVPAAEPPEGCPGP
jgi:hypothetical protein